MKCHAIAVSALFALVCASSLGVVADVVSDEFIVMFRQYDSASQLGTTLEKAARGPRGWKVVERSNRASKFPTDFVLVRFTSDAAVNRTSVLNSFAEDPSVKSVVPQRMITESSVKAETAAPQTTQMPTQADPQKPPTEPFRIVEMLEASNLWKRGFTGAGIRVAVFDTGLGKSHPHFRNVKERINWTNEDTRDDTVGHGTFVAGVIASQKECLGLAPDAELHIFRVFNKDRVSYTSWFLDAFNYAIHKRIHILNLSIGGPDFVDKPFVDKVRETSANGITVVSAIGNDGPVYGTGNNPADMPDVVGVGGMDVFNRVAAFSSRGMTLWELPGGYGRVKPDILTYGDRVMGSRLGAGCRSLSGTSVAAPVATGALTLLASAIPKAERRAKLNPAFMKQVLLKGAQRLHGANVFEQGFGKLNLQMSFEALANMTTHVSAIPDSLDLTDCPYMWPYCSQPLFFGAMPAVMNITILNSISVSGIIQEVDWHSGKNGDLLELSFDHSETVWPWSGWLSVRLRVAKHGTGIAEGVISVMVATGNRMASEVVRIPLRVAVIETPPRAKRLLWDQYHSIKYPPGFFPRDVISRTQRSEQFDWNGDHPHTNMREFYEALRQDDFFLDVLSEPYTCFNASEYGALLVVDPESEFSPQEIAKLTEDVDKRGLGLAVFADWYDLDVMNKLRFFDDNTKLWWSPATGGSNVPAINDLLSRWGIAFGGEAFEGQVAGSTPELKFSFLSGNGLALFPPDGSVVGSKLTGVHSQKLSWVPFLGALSRLPPAGPIVVFGDTSCFDTAHKVQPSCIPLAKNIVRFAVGISGIAGAFNTAIPTPLGTLICDHPPARPHTGELYVVGPGKDAACQRVVWTRDPVSRDDLAVTFPVPDFAPKVQAETGTQQQETQGTATAPFAVDKDGRGISAHITTIEIVVYLMLCVVGMALVVIVFTTRTHRTSSTGRNRRRSPSSV